MRWYAYGSDAPTGDVTTTFACDAPVPGMTASISVSLITVYDDAFVDPNLTDDAPVVPVKLRPSM